MGRLTTIVPKAPFCDFIEGTTSSKACPYLNHQDPSFTFIFFYFIFKLYIIALVLPNIKMNLKNSKILLLSSHSTFQYIMVDVAGRETNRAKRISPVKTSLQFYLNSGFRVARQNERFLFAKSGSPTGLVWPLMHAEVSSRHAHLRSWDTVNAHPRKRSQEGIRARGSGNSGSPGKFV